MNQVWLSGRLAGDPEVGQSQGGVSFAKFAIAMQHRSGENRETTFVDCVGFKQTADFLGQHFAKGDAIEVVGSLSVKDWQDPNGLKRRRFEVIVSRVSFPQTGKGRGANSGGYGSRQSAPRNGRAAAGAGAGASQFYDQQY